MKTLTLFSAWGRLRWSPSLFFEQKCQVLDAIQAQKRRFCAVEDLLIQLSQLIIGQFSGMVVFVIAMIKDAEHYDFHKRLRAGQAFQGGVQRIICPARLSFRLLSGPVQARSPVVPAKLHVRAAASLTQCEWFTKLHRRVNAADIDVAMGTGGPHSLLSKESKKP